MRTAGAENFCGMTNWLAPRARGDEFMRPVALSRSAAAFGLRAAVECKCLSRRDARPRSFGEFREENQIFFLGGRVGCVAVAD